MEQIQYSRNNKESLNADYKEEEIRLPEYVGNIGDMIKVNLTLVSRFSYNTQYGDMYLSVFKDTLDNVYRWSSKYTLAIEKGEYKTVLAIIKAYEEYKEQKQNVIIRCKIE